MKSRELLMKQFTSVTDVITRQEYFVAVIEAIQRSDKSIIGSVTGSSPNPEEAEVVQQILNSLSEASRRGVQIDYLLPLAPDRLRMAKKYITHGARVKFNPLLLVSDMRYMCVDDKLVIIGVPERGGKNEPTRKGYTIPSESVTHLFKTHFETHWNSVESKEYEEYLRELIMQAKASNSTASAELIARNLGIETTDVNSIFGQQ